MNSKSKKDRKKKHPNNNHNNKKQRKQNKKNPFSFYLKCKQVSAGWFKKSEKNFYLHIWEEEDKATDTKEQVDNASAKDSPERQFDALIILSVFFQSWKIEREGLESLNFFSLIL
jgi:hypothetical protein